MKKIINTSTKIIITFVIVLLSTNVFAYPANPSGIAGTEAQNAASGENFMNGILNLGNDFWNSGGTGNATIETAITDAIYAFQNVIEPVGVFVFFAAGAILGIKYIWSGPEGKSKIKDTLPAYLVGFLIFYLANSTVDLINMFSNDLLKNGDTDYIIGSIWLTLSKVFNVAAILGIIVMGLRYMYASADGKALVKQSIFPLIFGSVMVYAIGGLLQFLATTSDMFR